MTRGIPVSISAIRSGNPLLRSAVVACIVAGHFICAPAYAQAPLNPPASSITKSRPSDERPTLPEFKEAQQPELALPPVAPTPQDQLPYGIRLFVRQFTFTGNTVFTDAELAEVSAAYENREVTTEDLQQLRQALTLYYVKRGYINSGTVIPDQKVTDGVIQIQVIEGRLTRIDIKGTDRFHPDHIRDRLALGAGPPLNTYEMEQRLQIMLQNPLLETINASLVPGEQPGEAVLEAEVVESSPYTLNLGLDNAISPAIGEPHLWLQGSAANLAGRGDVLSGEIGAAEGLDELAIDYTIPITARDTLLSIRYDRSESEVVEDEFEELDIENENETIGIAVTHPLYRTPNSQFDLGLALELRSSESSLLGIPFSFAPGVEDGESEVTVIRFSQNWLNRSQNQVLALRSTFSFGIDAFGATINDDAPDSEFVAWLPQFQWAHRFQETEHQLIFRAEMQLSNEALLPLEKYTVGGIDTVRGYREDQLVGDQGYALTIEYRLPILRSESGQGNLQLSAFFDAGGTENKDAPDPDPDNIASVGLGLIWNPGSRFYAELFWANALEDVETSDDSLQDDGVHFRMVASFL